MVIKEELYQRYPNLTPLICSGVVEFLMSRDTISNLARHLALKDLLLVSRELDTVADTKTELQLHFSKEDMMCDTFYSLVGAIDNDMGVEAARSFVKDFLVCNINYEDLSAHVTLQHPHEQLSQILELNRLHPHLVELRTIAETGVNSEFPIYYVGVYYDGTKIAHAAHQKVVSARDDALRNAVYGCLEGDIDLKLVGGVDTTEEVLSDNIVEDVEDDVEEEDDRGGASAALA